MGAIAIHVPVAIGDASVTEEERDLVGGLWAKGDKVPNISTSLKKGREGGIGFGRDTVHTLHYCVGHTSVKLNNHMAVGASQAPTA